MRYPTPKISVKKLFRYLHTLKGGKDKRKKGKKHKSKYIKYIISSFHWLDIPYLFVCLLQNILRYPETSPWLPEHQKDTCQGCAELQDGESSTKAQTKGSPHSRKSNL
jgi:hypothetical protein